ncbi:MAG: thymidylate synthase, partial [Bacillaceae bacterium]|nr:thymidylate synthase [Bacillaceae bacterium]
MNIEVQYLNLCREILAENEQQIAEGRWTPNRTGMG